MDAVKGGADVAYFMTENYFQERTEEDAGSTKYKFMFASYKWALARIPAVGEKEILDCACGRGYGSIYLAGFARKVTGVDISEEAIEHCKTNYKKENLVFLKMDASELSFPDAKFDAIISQDTLEHVRDDRKFLKEMARVLKPGGVFIVLTPNSPCHNEKPDNPYHFREYSRESLDKLLLEYFRDRKYYGKECGKDLQELEAALSAVRNSDRFGVRRIVPRVVRHFVGNLIALARGLKRIDRIGDEDVVFTEDPTKSVTLIAVCRKEPG